MMLCDCAECSGNQDSFEPCINAQMEAEIELKKHEMNQYNFWIWFAVIVFVMFLAGAIA